MHHCTVITKNQTHVACNGRMLTCRPMCMASLQFSGHEIQMCGKCNLVFLRLSFYLKSSFFQEVTSLLCPVPCSGAGPIPSSGCGHNGCAPAATWGLGSPVQQSNEMVGPEPVPKPSASAGQTASSFFNVRKKF